jgi:uncharacterized protein (DUF362 family)
MSKLSRRDFLKRSTLGFGALSLAAILEACGIELVPPLPTVAVLPSAAPATDTPVSTPITIPVPTDTPQVPTFTAIPPTSTPVIPPDLVVATGGEPEQLVRQAIAALGGIQKFVPAGANVVIKPNICVAYRTYEYAATTNPWVVGTLVKLCFEAGAASVKVMDSPFNGSQEQAYKTSGIREQVEAAGGEMAYMLVYNFIKTAVPNGKSLKETSVYSDILKADVLINVPIAKTHSSSRLTLGMKNLMGVVLDRSALHANLGQCIADLNSIVRPQLTVIDAVRILTAYGPSGGSLSYVKKLDTLIASPDVVAADSFAATLFGMKPADLAYIVAGTAMGLGRSDLENLKIDQLSVGS